MRDEIDSRMWIEHHAAFSRSVGDLIGGVKRAFAGIKPALDHIHAWEFDSPWQRRGAGQA